jgi:rare lipoprotein A
MAQAAIRQVLALCAAGGLLLGCVSGTGGSGGGTAASDGATTVSGTKTSRGKGGDVEAPEVFQVTDSALWDGRPSLGGIWVASPDAVDPERVVLFNPANGTSVQGALFRRERDNPGPSLQISSDAADALGILAGQPVEIRVTALRRAEPEPEPEEAQADAAGATEEAAPDAEVPDAEVADAEAPDADDTSAAATAAAATAALAATGADGEAPAADAADPAADPEAAAAAAAAAEPAKPKTWKERRAEAKAAREAKRAAAKAAKEAAAAAEAATAGATAADAASAETAGVAAIETAPLDARTPDAVAPDAAPDPAPEATPEAAATPPAAEPAAGARPIQVASFSKQENAERAVQALAKIGVSAEARKSERSGKEVWGVVAMGDAAVLKTIKDAGFADAYFLQ